MSRIVSAGGLHVAFSISSFKIEEPPLFFLVPLCLAISLSPSPPPPTVSYFELFTSFSQPLMSELGTVVWQTDS